MATRPLTKQDLWDAAVGGSVLSTGGGGTLPTPQVFDAMVDPVFERGLTPQLIDVADVGAGQSVFMPILCGGGVQRDIKERYLLRPSPEVRLRPDFDANAWVQGQISQMDQLYPLPHWAERPGRTVADAAEAKLTELLGQAPVAYVPFEIGPLVLNQICSAALKGKPVVDGDLVGYRAVPEFSLIALNVIEARITPAVLATAWGDLLVYDKLLSWQRFEDLNRYIAVASGGSVNGMLAVSADDLKRGGAVAGTISKSIEIGRAVRAVLSGGKDPIQAVLETAKGHRLFQGRIAGFIQEEKDAFMWGESRIEGTGRYAGHNFRVWFKNENHMSWLDGRPYVSSPDLVCILDTHSGVGLANFWARDYEWGRDVTVVGFPSADIWRTPRGLKIFSPWRFGYYVDYVPIEKRVQGA